MESTKLFKVTIEISICNSSGMCELSRETRTQFFESLDDAIRFTRDDLHYTVVKKQIWEYMVSSIKELHQKEREVVRQVVDIEKYWE